jgi:hypothetical protein
MKTNIYKHTFVAECPSNHQPIVYQLTVTHDQMVRVEHITMACALIKRGFHEDIADQLFERFSGSQVLCAHHHGVDIETHRNTS